MILSTRTPKSGQLVGVGLALAALVALAMAVFTAGPAKAASPWSGCGMQAHGGLLNIAADVGGGAEVGTSGQNLGASLLCDLQMGNMVVGGFVEYDRIFGNAFKLGFNSDTTVGGRVGVLPQPNTLLYVHGGRSWYDTDGGTFEGWKLGAGAEIRLPTASPLFFDMRYTHAWIDDAADVRGDAVRVGLTLKFGAAMQPAILTPPLK